MLNRALSTDPLKGPSTAADAATHCRSIDRLEDGGHETHAQNNYWIPYS